MPYNDTNKWVIITESARDSYAEVIRIHMQMYGNASIYYSHSKGLHEVRSTISYDPENDGLQFELFRDAVRNAANMGWPEYDPFRVEH